MREPRVHTDQALESGRRIRLEPAAGRHLVKVLRLRPDAPLRLFNGDGREFQGRLSEVSGSGVTAAVEVLSRIEPDPPLRLNLLLGVSKGERMDFAIRKAVELGVTGIAPLFTARSVVRLERERLLRRTAHWHSLVVSACEQSGRCRLPHLAPPQPLAAGMDNGGSDLRLLLYHRGDTGLERLPAPRRRIDLLVGPEGGLAAGEIRLARERGFVPIRLGPRIMRAETAPLAALAAIQMLWGDFRGSGGGR